MNTVKDVPCSAHHHSVNRQPRTGKDKRIQNRFSIVTGQHRALVIQNDDIRVPAGSQLPCSVTAGEAASLQDLLEQASTCVAVPNGRNISRAARKTLPIFEPAKFFMGERTLKPMAVGVGGARNYDSGGMISATWQSIP